MTEKQQLTALCQRLGAAPTQAEAMAAQLIKRADQLVTDRGMSRVAAMEYLLDLLVKGRSGAVPDGFTSGPPPDAQH